MAKHIAIDARIISSTTGRYVLGLLKYLQELDEVNDYTVLVKSKDLDYWKPSNSNFKVMVADFKEFTFSEQLGYFKFLKNLNADLVHFTQFQQPLLYRKNKITTMHDLTLVDFVNKRGGGLKGFYRHTVKPAVFKLVIKQMLNASRFIITPTQFVKKSVAERLKIAPGKIKVTLEASDQLTNTPKAHSGLNNDKYLLYVGNTPPYKNLERVIAAMPKINKETGAILILAGKENDFTPNLKQAAKKHGATDFVRWIGFVPDEELAWLYQSSLATITPSLSEGFGLPGLEAMRHGSIVVSSDATCLPEVYGKAAHYFDPESVQSIEDAVIELGGNDKLRVSLRAAAEKQYKKYSWRKMAQETHDLYIKSM